ncbi:S8 family peptidase [Spirosoma flavum]|uniref:S8 family serine peptidase n=1 Tax=Spirosoma flavum TaxID=2048557 RepID=A0ABW6AL34_9BACT
MAGRLGLWDGGRVLGSHLEFAGATAGTNRISQKDNVTTLNNHTTHLAGTLIAKGVNEQAKGMAYGAQLSVWDYTDDMTELTIAAPKLLVSNHSYGPVVGWVYNGLRFGTDPNLKWEWWGNTAISETEDYLFGFYTTKAHDLDRIAYNNPFFLMVRSADNKRGETGPPTGTPYFLKATTTQSKLSRSRNDAYDVVPAEATAKNLLTVGAADISFTNQNQPVLLESTAFSGWGPTDDGRIKPDLLGVGSSVLSSLATADTAYGMYSGTSMASANVAGSLFLLQELYASQRAAGLPTSGQFMRAATLKGLALHTANRPNPTAGPDYRQGWGLLNTEAAARLLLNENLAHLILEKTLTPSGTFTQSLVAQGSEPLLITLCWTDPEGEATSVTASSLNNRTPKLINDLDLRLSNGQYNDFPFVLDPARPAQAATRGDNSRDNVEQIYIANPVAGQTYTLRVSHKGKMTYSSQPFSLLISGLRRVNCSLAVSIQPTQATTICTGMMLVLRASSESAGVRYQWLRNGVILTNTITSVCQVTQTGSYIVRVINDQGCSATSQPVQIQVHSPLATIAPNSDQWLCEARESVDFQLTSISKTSSTNTIIDWLRDGTPIDNSHTTSLNITQPGHYQVRVTQDGCRALSVETEVLRSSVSSLDVVPEETSLTLPQGSSVTLKASVDTSYRYQWYRNDQPLINDRDYRLSVTQAGTYKVQVTQQGCIGWSTNRVVQTSILTAVTADPTGQFVVYPNPAEHTISIRYVSSLAKQIQVSIFDLRGVLQQSPFQLNDQNGQFKGDISVHELPAGSYILRLTDGYTTQTGRFVKK